MRTLLAVIVCLALIGSVGVCFAQTQLVSDNFDSGVNGTYLGSNWTGCGFFLGTYNKLVYQNNMAGGGGYYSQNCALYTGYGAFPSDQYATATVVAANPASTTQAGIQLRQSVTPSNPESYIACGWNAQDFPADFHYRIWSMAPNPPTGGPSSLFLTNVVPATNDVIWCQVLGTTITMEVNGSIVASVTDTSGLTTGFPGLYYVDPNGSAPPSDDVIFDTFSAGAGPALVSLAITPTSTSAIAGSFVQFTGVATYADGTTATISNWSSSDPTVAAVDSTGFAYAANAGTVTITGASGVDTGTATLTVSAAQGYTPLVHDSFSGPTGSYLGSNWTGCGYYGGSYSPLVYQNNEAGGGGYYSQECAIYTGYGTFPNDQYATATVVAANPSGTPQAGVQLRQSATPSSPEYYIACGWNAQDFPADYHYRIWSMQPNPPTGGPTSLFLSNVTPAPNDVIWCQVTGTTVNMQVNGTTIATVTDNSGVTSGYPGLYYIDPNGDVPPPTDVIFDSFVAGQVNGPVLTSLAITPNPASVPTGSSVQLTATGTYTDGTTANISSSASWVSSNPAVATINANGLASGVAPGTVTITATSGTKNNSATLTVTGQLSPTVTFTGAPANAPYNGTFTVTATTNASVMPTISGTAGVCSVGAVTGTPANANALVTMLSGSGTCIVSASWTSDANYSAAGPLTQSTSASSVAPTVTFTGAPASSAYKGTFTVTATTNASVMPTISGTAGICSVGAVTGSSSSAQAVVTMLSGTGSCTVSAAWAASGNYSAAGPLTQTTNASMIAPTVTFTGAPASAGYSTSFNVTATTNASTMPQITGTANVCSVGTVSGSPASATAAVTMLGNSGTCTLTATWAADANYTAPAPRNQTTTATKAASTTSITSNTPNPSGLQQAVTINFSVSGGGVGPTGSVTVTASTRETCTGTLNSSHIGSCSITFTTGGTRTLTAAYAGDSNFTGSSSGTVSQTVNSPTVNLSPASLNFGNVSRNNKQTKTETLSNTGTGALVNLSWSITGTNASQFSISSTTCGTTLNAGASCTFSITFAPTVTGNLTANLRLTDSATNSPQNVTLSGSGK